MREIRLHGSEGGGAELNRSFLPLSRSSPAIPRISGPLPTSATSSPGPSAIVSVFREEFTAFQQEKRMPFIDSWNGGACEKGLLEGIEVVPGNEVRRRGPGADAGAPRDPRPRAACARSLIESRRWPARTTCAGSGPGNVGRRRRSGVIDARTPTEIDYSRASPIRSATVVRNVWSWKLLLVR